MTANEDNLRENELRLNDQPQSLESNTNRTESSSALTENTNRVRPWIRHWARFLDYWIFGAIIGIFLGLSLPEWLSSPLLSSNILITMMMVIGSPFIEAFMLSRLGWTVGKLCLGTRVYNSEMKRLTYLDALKRSYRVVFFGMGLGIPIVTLITQVNAYYTLKARAKCSWDEEQDINVIHEEISCIGIVMYAMLALALISLAIIVGIAESYA